MEAFEVVVYVWVCGPASCATLLDVVVSVVDGSSYSSGCVANRSTGREAGLPLLEGVLNRGCLDRSSWESEGDGSQEEEESRGELHDEDASNGKVEMVLV